MLEIFSFIFNNALLIGLVGVGIFIYKQYSDLKKQQTEINDKFKERLYPYLDEKYKSYKEIIDQLKNEYVIEEIQIELGRIDKIIEPGLGGTLNDYVNVSNKINKYKLNKSFDLNRFPNLTKLNDLQTFTEEEMNSVDNGLAYSRREYNTLAFRYNEKATNFPMQYLTKILKLTVQYTIFDQVKTNTYSKDFEVFEEVEPEINSLANLNKQLMRRENILMDNEEKEEVKEIKIEHSDVVLKPTIKIEGMIESDNKIENEETNQND